MNKNNLTINKLCPICKSKNIIDKKKIPSKNIEINFLFSLKNCLNCKHRFLSSFPSEKYLNELHFNNSKYLFGEEPSEVYEKAKFKSEGFRNVLSFKRHWIFKFLDINQKGKYLEIGPGLCRLYKTFYEKNWYCEGLDLQPFIKAPGIVNSLEQIEDNSKDVAVATDVIEHTINPTKFLKDINSKLKKNGLLFLTFPNADSFKSIMLNNRWNMVVPLAHLNFFSKRSIKISLREANFEIIYLKAYSLSDPKRFLKNFVKLPFRLLKDLICLNFRNFFSRIKEFVIGFFDLLHGDQMKITARKII